MTMAIFNLETLKCPPLTVIILSLALEMVHKLDFLHIKYNKYNKALYFRPTTNNVSQHFHVGISKILYFCPPPDKITLFVV